MGAGDIVAEMVAFPVNGGTTPGYLARPAANGRFPAVVVIQEWWGLVPHIKDVAERFARAGYVALAPDLYHGQAAAEPDEARKLAMSLEIPRALQEIRAAARYLADMPQVAGKGVGVIGWCMGGRLAWQTAVSPGDAPVGAVVAFYGRPPTEAEAIAQITVPVLGIFAEHDHGIPLEAVETVRNLLGQQGKTYEIHVYPGTQHAFFNDTRPHIYNAEAATDAWEKTLAWFGRYLS
ncbi:MAG: dienelactone hydrolase family protein [Chloroflexi bacterium]|nr:MAG: dienelactone hydrolase family protein [Chloroflexota bacterium]